MLISSDVEPRHGWMVSSLRVDPCCPPYHWSCYVACLQKKEVWWSLVCKTQQSFGGERDVRYLGSIPHPGCNCQHQNGITFFVGKSLQAFICHCYWRGGRSNKYLWKVGSVLGSLPCHGPNYSYLGDDHELNSWRLYIPYSSHNHGSGEARSLQD